MSVTSVNPLTATTTSSTTTVGASDAAESQDRFLKLLVAQMANQDPMSPMDNAQMTSQMAQINTVTGIQQLNETVKGLTQQFTNLQVLQGTSLVGREVLTSGNSLSLDGLTGKGAIDLYGNADSVKVEVMSAGGQVLDTLNLGARTAGRVMFEWTAPASLANESLSYKVTATQGSTPVQAATLARDKVVSVGSEYGALTLELQGQKLAPLSAIMAYL